MNEDSDSQDILTIQAPIQAVTVFHRGALVQRRAELRAPTSRLLVQGLPLCLDDATLVARIEGKGAPAVTDLRAALQVTDVDRQAPPEQAAVDAAASAVRRARDQVERLEARLQDLDTLSSPDRPVAKRGQPAPAVPTGARLALLAFRAKVLDKTSESLAMASDDLRRAEEEHRALQDALRRASTAREPRAQELRKAAHLTLVGLGEGAGPWTLHLEYLVPGAR
ncbi:MAG: DUF4140 domain-containing protein, partial [Oligoflexia bacterium]|nr:DUF4140 domain-containing protein [Oligoflexia bacterium]